MLPLLSTPADWQHNIDRSLDGFLETFRSYPGARQSPAIEAALAQMPAKARQSVRGPIKRGALAIIAQPWPKLEFALGLSALDEVALSDLAPDAAIGMLSVSLGIMKSLAGHYAYDANRMVALRQAMLAARFARRCGSWAAAKRRVG